MRSWKKRLNDEFDAAAPALKSDVLNAPVITAQNETSDIRSGNVLLKRKIGIFTSCGAVLILVIVLTFLAIFGVFSSHPVIERFVFSLEINPAVSFVTDKDGNVKSVNSLNEDADIILSDESTLSKLKNIPLSEAVVTYTDCAARLGYLDLTLTQNAVRLSSSTETDKALFESACGSLRDYFKATGIFAVVVEDIIPVRDLSERIGISGANTLSELTDKVESLSVRYSERNIGNATEEQLKSLYETYVVGTQLFDFVQGELLDNVSNIIRNAQMLSQMGLCSYNIMMHKDNPFNPIPADYWTVKKYPNAEYSPEFAALMDEMNGLLTEYKDKFGASINSINDLTSAADAYSSLSGIDFEKLFSELTISDFQSSVSKYVGMLKNIGDEVSALETLLSVPQTTQEYLTQLQTVLKQIFGYKTEQYRDIYEQTRHEISDTDYSDFVAAIIQEYGSLENFWNKK